MVIYHIGWRILPCKLLPQFCLHQSDSSYPRNLPFDGIKEMTQDMRKLVCVFGFRTLCGKVGSKATPPLISAAQIERRRRTQKTLIPGKTPCG